MTVLRQALGAAGSGWRGIARAAVLVVATLGLAACATSSGYGPRVRAAAEQDIAELREQFALAGSIKQFYAGANTAERRNEFIAGRLTLYNLEYLEFVRQFQLSRAQEATIFDLASLGLGLGTTLAGTENAKTALGAITTALTGARNSYEKNFFEEKTAAALVTQMNAERKTALIPILDGAKASIEDYPLTSAIADLAAYQFAGTIEGALQGVQRDAGVKDAKAQAQLDRFRSVSYAPDNYSERIEKWIWPGFATRNRQGQSLDAQGNPIARVDANWNALLAEMSKLGLGQMPYQTFIAAPGMAQMRAQLVQDLNIP